MKTQFRLFTSLMLLFLLAGAVISCSDDDMEGDTLSYEESLEAIDLFMSKTYPDGFLESVDERNRKEQYKKLDGRDICFVINSKEELSSVYSGDVEIPNIDFSKISLVLCHIMIPNGRTYEYENFSVDNNEKETVVTLYFKYYVDPAMAYLANFVDFYFYKVVSKLEESETARAEAKYSQIPDE